MAALDLAALTLLLVDDVEFSRKTVERLIRGMGGENIETAADGAEALDILRRTKTVDFVISDFNMPVMNGLQLLKAIRSGQAGVSRGLPFAMLTGFSDKHLVDMALALDVNAFLVKPVSKSTLTQRLEKMLERSDDDDWVKQDNDYGLIAIEEAEVAEAAAAISRDETIEAYKAMRRETPPESAPRPGEIDPRQMGRSATVMRRLSSLKGKFDESDLTRNINRGVEKLVADTGDKTASRIVSYLDGLVKRDILGLDDLQAVLSGAADADDDDITETPAADDGKEKGKPAPAADVGKKPAAAEQAGESFRPLSEIPAQATLARNLNTVDGSLFMVAGTALTAQIISILRHLESLDVLALETVGGRNGIYVLLGAAAGAPQPVSEADAAPDWSGESQIDINELQAGAVITRDIYTVDGRLYLPAGSQVSRRVVAILQDLDHLGNIQSQLWVATS